MAGAEVPALAGLDASAAEPAGLDPVEVHQPLQDAPDGGFRQAPAITLQLTGAILTDRFPGTAKKARRAPDCSEGIGIPKKLILCLTAQLCW